MAQTNIIEVRNLEKSFDSHKVLQGINLDIAKGKSLVILGGSGSGKSVLIKSIIGLIEIDAGEIYINGVATSKLSEKSRFAMMAKMGFLFQGGALFDSLTIEDNITFYTAKAKNLNAKDKRDLAADKLKTVGLAERILDLYPSDLSGGMQKRVSLARAICAEPEIIFFDEPTTGLDPIMANVINELIVKFKEDLGATTITITHDMHSANMIADEVAMLSSGKILWRGNKKELYKSKNEVVDQFVNGRTTGPILT